MKRSVLIALAAFALAGCAKESAEGERYVQDTFLAT